MRGIQVSTRWLERDGARVGERDRRATRSPEHRRRRDHPGADRSPCAPPPAESIDARAVLLATPAYAASTLLRERDEELARLAGEIPYCVGGDRGDGVRAGRACGTR